MLPTIKRHAAVTALDLLDNSRCLPPRYRLSAVGLRRANSAGSTRETWGGRGLDEAIGFDICFSCGKMGMAGRGGKFEDRREACIASL